MGRHKKHTPITSGKVFGRLTAVEYIDNRYLSCKCTCGNIKIVREDHLRSGCIKSCGCIRRESSIQLGKIRRDISGPEVGDCFEKLKVCSVSSDGVLCECCCGKIVLVRRDHLLNGDTKSCGCGRITACGLSNTKEYSVWRGILDRCYNPKCRAFKYYGARGIYVHSNWLPPNGFVEFINHIGYMPSQNLTIDRINNYLGYEPGNVRWATRQEQARNTRKNHIIIAFGKSQCLQAWAEEIGINKSTIRLRLESGWTNEEAVALPKGSRREVL